MYGAGRSRITHPFATLTQEQAPGIPFDLHVLSTPPAFILSQDQTLHCKISFLPSLAAWFVCCLYLGRISFSFIEA